MLRKAFGQVLWVTGVLSTSACQWILGDFEDKGSGGTTSASDGSGGHGGTTGSSGSSGGSGGTGGHGGTTGSGGSGGTGSVSCGAGISPCGKPDDCPVPSNACILATCQAGCCGTHWVDADTPIATQTLGDCHEMRCDGAGQATSYPNDNDVPVSSTVCLAGGCNNGTPYSKPVTASCNENGGKVCGEVNGSKAGTCVECNTGADCSSSICVSNTCVAASCTDKVKNGAETDLDCGGDSCPPCAYGKGCDSNNDCATGACVSSTCAACLPGVARCSDDNAPQVCDTNGTWKTLSACGDTKPTCCQGQCTVSVKDIEAGYFHTCARMTNKTLWCWGDNQYGQLGNGLSTTSSSTPVAVAVLGEAVEQVAVGVSHTCARLSDGTLQCWGANLMGQLGDGTTVGRSTPKQVTSLGYNVNQVTAGQGHTCVLKVDKTVWCWGSNVNGQLGDGSTTTRTAPVQVMVNGNALSAVSAVSAGFNHTCALKENGTVWCWGNNSKGQLGDGSSSNAQLQPVQVTGLNGTATSVLPATQVSAGAFHTCALVAKTPYCWGDNSKGQIGQGTPGAILTSATKITTLPNQTSTATVAAGNTSTCVLVATNTVWCWGENRYGQLGNGTYSILPVLPVKSLLNPLVTSLSVGASYACATLANGSAWCWGYNPYGNLGDGSMSQRTRPLPVRLGLGVCEGDSCNNGVKDSSVGESDIDCGGSCLSNGLVCAKGMHCNTSYDCAALSACASSYTCVDGCFNGVKDNAETDIDCGGGPCLGCAVGKKCMMSEDCGGHTCSSSGVCVCAAAQIPCNTNSDCCSGTCSAITHMCN